MSSAAPTSLAEQIADLKAASAARVPAEVLAVFTRQAEALSAAEPPVGVAAVGTPLPDVQLTDALGVTTSVRAVTGERPAVLVFYRGAWCPYCNLTLKAYGEQLFGQLTARGAGLVAISPQKPDESLSIKEKHGLAFPVLSDAGNALAGELGLLTGPRSDEVREAQERLGLDLPSTNADGTETIPMPTVVIADADRVIRWIDVRPDYTTRTEVEDILAALDTIL
jgi:peroxiredoxin